MIEQFISTYGYLLVSLFCFGFAYKIYKDYKSALRLGIHGFAGVVCLVKWILEYVGSWR